MPPLTPGQVPDEEAVDVSEQQVARFGGGTGASDIVQYPADLQAAEIGGQRQTGLRAKAILAAIGGEFRDRIGNPRVLPDDGVVNRLARHLVPQNGSFPLIGDADA